MQVFKLEPEEKEALLERFVRYAQVDTQSDDTATCSPSTEKQKDLGRLLVEELKALGCADATMDTWGYVTATVHSNLPPDHPEVPVVGFLAHMDTYPATPGGGVKPQIIRNYRGGDIPLPGTPGRPIPEAKNPNLQRCIGHTVVTSDGTTLLGADDKDGIAAIMTLIDWLRSHPGHPHGTLRIGFTTDEEVGRGTEHFDVAAFGAKYAYTVDGAELGEIEDESFCADSALVTITGHDTHPGHAKGAMVNAVRIAAELIARLPQDHLPETTAGRESFLHPHHLAGGVAKAEVKLLVRAFTEPELAEREASLRAAADATARLFPGCTIQVEFKASYRNMGLKIAEDPKVLDFALEAIRRQGITPVRKPIRGGTDGSRLSYMGLLTPNVFGGAQSYHSVHEWVSLEWMAASVECCLQIASVWVERSRG
jgi:tripeptide aminopeptidase